MKTRKASLIGSLIGTAVGLGSWVYGLGQTMWPAHPQMASFLLTLRHDHRDSDCLASADSNEFTVNCCYGPLRSLRIGQSGQ
jgi:hypothetical protein